MIEIVDLEAKFLRAPLHLVLDKVIKGVRSYLHNTILKSFNPHNLCLISELHLDDLSTPFELKERFQKILTLINANFEVSKLIDPKCLSNTLGKKVVNQNSLEYHI